LLPFEKNGLLLSTITLGTVQLGLPYGIANQAGQPSFAQSCEIINTARSGGVCWLDTARGYGESEAIIGKYLSTHDKQPIPHLVTKFTLDKKLEGKDIEHHIMQSVQESLRLLGVSKIDMVMLHHASDLLLWGTTIRDACAKLIKEGYANKIGVSLGAESEQQFYRIWEYAQEPIFEGIQVPLNLVDQRLIRSGALKLMADAGKIVFARSIYLQGLLCMNPGGLPARISEAEPILLNVHRLAEREGISVEQMAFAYVRDMPGVSSLVIGAETSEQVERNIRLAECPPLRESTIHSISQLFADIPEKVISPHLW